MSRPSTETYAPSSIYTPSLGRTTWEEIKEEDEKEEEGESSSGIGSLRTDLLSPVSTRSSYSATDLLSPVSGRSNVTVTVADVHHYDEMQEENSEIKIDRREIPDTTIYTVRTF